MRGWAFNFELGVHSRRTWSLWSRDNLTSHVGNVDWANPLFNPEIDMPHEVRTSCRMTTGSTTTINSIDLQWLRYIDDQGYEHWPVIGAWEFSWTNPFMGYPYFTYKNRDYNLRYANDGYTLDLVPLPRYDGTQLPASLSIRRLEDSVDYKEVLIVID